MYTWWSGHSEEMLNESSEFLIEIEDKTEWENKNRVRYDITFGEEFFISYYPPYYPDSDWSNTRVIKTGITYNTFLALTDDGKVNDENNTTNLIIIIK